MTLTDLDLLFDYYTSVNIAAGGYATISSRVKDDKLENIFRKMAREAMRESKEAAGMVIKLGGDIF
jgi:DNA gyrase inhibitor GyrI